MFYRLSAFYKRDTSFVYQQSLNKISWLELRSGKQLSIDEPLQYTTDKIDSYISDYDLLPSIGIPLVSKKWKSEFEDLNNVEIQFLPALIKDETNNVNNQFYALNILNTISCLDKEKSVFEIDEDGDYDIKKFFISFPENVSYSIVKMQEYNSYIIVTEKFKKRCEEAGLKGLHFIEEGHSIYKEV